MSENELACVHGLTTWCEHCESENTIDDLRAQLAAETKRAYEAERITAGCRDLIATLRRKLAEAEQSRDEATLTYKAIVAVELDRRAEAEQARDEAVREVERLKGVITQTWKECDDARMSEVDDARNEAEHWKSEGDMYGWNFHQGRAAGMITASVIYHRVERAALLQPKEAGDE